MSEPEEGPQEPEEERGVGGGTLFLIFLLAWMVLGLGTTYGVKQMHPDWFVTWSTPDETDAVGPLMCTIGWPLCLTAAVAETVMQSATKPEARP